VALADYLKIQISDILKMSHLEYKTWLAYFQVQKREHDNEMRKQGGGKRANNPRRHR
jgi:hypothetical protein